MITSDIIKQKALSIGVDLVGITTAEPFPKFINQMESAILSGRISSDHRQTEDILDRYRYYSDPRNSLSEARSMIVMGMRYLLDEGQDEGTPSDPRGMICRIYWRDFFPLLDEKRGELIRFLLENGVKVAECSLVPIKAAAQRAGVGVYGKNTIIQNEEFGSWVTYRVIITDLDLVPDEEQAPRCGSCQRCIRLCPTKAMTEPYVMAPARCINHLLASPEPIPLELREAIGGRINGCDICQEVCPRNANVEPIRSEVKETWGEWTKNPRLLSILDMTEEAFQQHFKELDWDVPSIALLKRNALIALGNTGDLKVLSHIERFLSCDDAQLREHASWAVDNIKRRN